MINLILVRHGQSQWNLENRFTGWYDAALTKAGVVEAEKAGSLIKSLGLNFNYGFTSYQTRAIKTFEAILETSNIEISNVIKAWQLNERHYGGLQGLNKEETKKKLKEHDLKHSVSLNLMLSLLEADRLTFELCKHVF